MQYILALIVFAAYWVAIQKVQQYIFTAIKNKNMTVFYHFPHCFLRDFLYLFFDKIWS